VSSGANGNWIEPLRIARVRQRWSPEALFRRVSECMAPLRRDELVAMREQEAARWLAAEQEEAARAVRFQRNLAKERAVAEERAFKADVAHTALERAQEHQRAAGRERIPGDLAEGQVGVLPRCPVCGKPVARPHLECA
jgi:hypothetical protein